MATPCALPTGRTGQPWRPVSTPVEPPRQPPVRLHMRGAPTAHEASGASMTVTSTAVIFQRGSATTWLQLQEAHIITLHTETNFQMYGCWHLPLRTCARVPFSRSWPQFYGYGSKSRTYTLFNTTHACAGLGVMH